MLLAPKRIGQKMFNRNNEMKTRLDKAGAVGGSRDGIRSHFANGSRLNRNSKAT
jgi:hypothetical protein